MGTCAFLTAADARRGFAMDPAQPSLKLVINIPDGVVPQGMLPGGVAAGAKKYVRCTLCGAQYEDCKAEAKKHYLTKHLGELSCMRRLERPAPPHFDGMA